MMFCSLGEKMDNIKLNLIHIEKLSNVKENRVSGITTEPTILDLKNKTTWPGFPLYLSRPSCVAYVHKPSIVHPPILCKSARRTEPLRGMLPKVTSPYLPHLPKQT